VYRVDSVEHEDPNAVQNAINTATRYLSAKLLSIQQLLF
jgi:hypothetical protein